MRLALLLPLACSVSAFVAPLPRDGRARRAAAVHCSAEAATVAIITGGSGGIGLATAHRLAAKGFDCVLAYGSNDEQAASARSELEAAHGVRVRTVRGDLTQDESRVATVAEVFRLVDEELSGKVGRVRARTLHPRPRPHAHPHPNPATTAHPHPSHPRQVGAFVHAAGFFADDLLSHHFDGAVASFEVYDAYQSIYPKAFVNLAEGCLPRMQDGQGKLVCVRYPGRNHRPTPQPDRHPTLPLPLTR